MSQPPNPHPPGQRMPNGRPRPGAFPQAPDEPSFQSRPRYIDYGNPRAFDTSVRPASGPTAARYAPAPIHRPQQAQPQSAWSTQPRRVQEVAQEASRLPLGGILVWLAVVMLGIAMIVVLGYFFLEFVLTASSSPAWWPVTAFLAFISLVVITAVMVLADRWDPQPLPLLIIAVLWGAAIAAFTSYLINTFNTELAYILTGNLDFAQRIVGPVISAPLVEEISKGLGLILLMLLARRYFNSPLDGLIYGALIGGGFAFTENIIYYTRQLEISGVGDLVVLVVVRGVLNIFGHAIYTSLTGVLMALVARKWGTVMGLLAFVVALIPGIGLHAAWNLFAGFSSIVVLIALMVIQALLSLLWLILIAGLVFDESRLTRVRLGDYANRGWLTHEEVDMLATWKGRREGKRWADQLGARPIMKRFIRESADLASVRQRLLADGANPKVVAIEAHLLHRLTANRAELLQRTG